ncbi:hypothetical protein BpHYR1_017206 [Brachionus plicatilis]|uniref:Uncharacterized protein n=1 Tax=Brachionus plicatilis TaxID=10195 RepID=A0A3M7R7Y3_BRAPC|nr:hypothetical protein BpHYR1_017206 [Brachionus plicatilis]
MKKRRIIIYVCTVFKVKQYNGLRSLVENAYAQKKLDFVGKILTTKSFSEEQRKTLGFYTINYPGTKNKIKKIASLQLACLRDNI